MHEDKTPSRALAAIEFWFLTKHTDSVISLGELGIDYRTVAILERANVNTVKKLCRLTRQQLLHIDQIGDVIADEIEVALECNGLRLAKKLT